MTSIPEPDIETGLRPEETFQAAIKEGVRLALDQLISNGTLGQYFILEKFGLDIAVFLRWQDNSVSAKFLEMKAFVGSRQGGVGFGNGKGEGPQVELLLLDSGKLGVADRFVRWVLVDGTKEKGIERYTIFDSNQARRSAMGQVTKGKQNNLRVQELMRDAMTWNKLLNEIRVFLMSGS